MDLFFFLYFIDDDFFAFDVSWNYAIKEHLLRNLYYMFIFTDASFWKNLKILLLLWFKFYFI